MANRTNPFDVFAEMDRMLDRMHRSMMARDSDTRAPSAGIEMDATGGMDGMHGEASDGDVRWLDAAVTVEETDDGYVVLVDVPGFEREELEIRYDEGSDSLSIEGEHDADEAGVRPRRVAERVRLQLPEGTSVDLDGVSASYHNGVLEVHLPTMAAAEGGHRIDIE